MEATSELALRVIASMQISQPSLRPADEQDLAELLEQTALRYPNQDLAPALEGYYQDYLVLVRRYGIEAVRLALQELRVMPGQRFFPQPSECAEVAEEIVKAKKAVENRERVARKPLCGRCMSGLIRVERNGVGYMRPCPCQRKDEAPASGKDRAANG